MTRPATARHLSIRQRAGVFAWRSLMATIRFATRFRRLSPPGAITNHSYDAHKDERIELIEPRADAPTRAPVVFVHGGGWICGKKEIYTRDLLFLAEAGHPVFNVEYPLAPERPHPHMLLSLLESLAWIRRQHPEHESVHLMGDSAGGNLAVMLAILTENPALIRTLDPDFTPVLPRTQSVVSVYGVLDRLSWIEKGFPSALLMLYCYGGPEARKPEVDPAYAITPVDLEFAALPPTMIAVGSKDPLAESSRICAEHLRKHFEPVEYEVYPGETHGFFNRAGRPACQKLRGDILGFFEQH